MLCAGITEAMANQKRAGSIHLTQQLANAMLRKYLRLQLNAYSSKEKLASTAGVSAVLLLAILPANMLIWLRF